MALLTSYCFPHLARAELGDLLQKQAPRPDDKIMLLSTGSEADELCLKLSRERGRRLGKKSPVFVTFSNAFHGRTMGSQLAGGIPSLKEWIGYPDEHFVQVPFPDGVRCKPEENDFAAFEKALKAQKVDPERVCGVLSETYQGGNSSFAPASIHAGSAQVCDLVSSRADHGRSPSRLWPVPESSGRLSIYGIQPDLIALRQGHQRIAAPFQPSSPQRADGPVPPGSMTSTHSGNPVCCAAAVASLKLIVGEKLAERSAKMGEIMQQRAAEIQKQFKCVILAHHGKGPGGESPVWSSRIVLSPTPRLAWEVVGRAVQTGVMMFGRSALVAPASSSHPADD